MSKVVSAADRAHFRRIAEAKGDDAVARRRQAAGQSPERRVDEALAGLDAQAPATPIERIEIDVPDGLYHTLQSTGLDQDAPELFEFACQLAEETEDTKGSPQELGDLERWVVRKMESLEQTLGRLNAPMSGFTAWDRLVVLFKTEKASRSLRQRAAASRASR